VEGLPSTRIAVSSCTWPVCCSPFRDSFLFRASEEVVVIKRTQRKAGTIISFILQKLLIFTCKINNENQHMIENWIETNDDTKSDILLFIHEVLLLWKLKYILLLLVRYFFV